jgi:hypothetical protein
MWVKEGHSAPAPQEWGRRIATLDRGRKGELRVTIQDHEGYEYVGLRLWERGQDGQYYPTRIGLNLRMTEVPELARVLAEVGNVARATSPPEPPPKVYDRRGARRPAVDFTQLPKTGPARTDFDECN